MGESASDQPPLNGLVSIPPARGAFPSTTWEIHLGKTVSPGAFHPRVPSGGRNFFHRMKCYNPPRWFGIGVAALIIVGVCCAQGEKTVKPNRLIHEKSPYLLQHAHNPVDWYPWGEEAFEKARREKQPIFLSIGYSTCHWCHVMERESFEDPATAALMNQHLVSIKVDREERPDVDALYMQAVMAMAGQGGWPLSVFLTPDLKPFYGGTYFPPEDRWGHPGFKSVLKSIAGAW